MIVFRSLNKLPLLQQSIISGLMAELPPLTYEEDEDDYDPIYVHQFENYISVYVLEVKGYNEIIHTYIGEIEFPTME